MMARPVRPALKVKKEFPAHEVLRVRMVLWDLRVAPAVLVKRAVPVNAVPPDLRVRKARPAPLDLKVSEVRPEAREV
jgi:hypothetical protein